MRPEDWQDRFWEAMDEAQETSFEWGVHDCVLFSCKMATAIGDRNYVEDARAAFSWSSASEALELTREGLQALIESVLGPMEPWTRLGHGDLVLVLDDAGRESLVIHDGCQLIGVAQHGVRPIPMRCAKGGWKVE